MSITNPFLLQTLLVPKSMAKRLRADIQALRAIAVLLVIAYHVSPTCVTGGFIGVDVFFVISGYLITGQLVREINTTGRIDLPHFYARRAQRLLPASSLTLVAVGLASYVWMPPSTWATTAADMAASSLYVQNWMLVRRSVDYLAQGQMPSPLQHFWSLSVEEQFYFIWPLLLGCVVASWKRLRTSGRVRCDEDQDGPPSARYTQSHARSFRCALAVPISVLCVLSVVTAVYARVNPAPGYFMTHVRMHELGLGGLLAVWASGDGESDVQDGARRSHWPAWGFRARTCGAAVGLIGIFASGFLYSHRLPFPGIAASIPVLCTALIIASGEKGGPSDSDEALHAFAPLLAKPWLQYVGGLSYSLYLAHWPVLVMYPFSTGKQADSSVADGAFVVLLSFALAQACKAGWEDRFRSAKNGRDGQCQSNVSDPDALARKPWHQSAGADDVPISFDTFCWTCRIRSNLKTAALVTLALMCTSLSSSLVLFKLPEMRGVDAPNEQVDDIHNVFNSTEIAAPIPRRPLDSQKCSDFYGPRASRPHPGADIVFYGCSELNSLPVIEAIPRLGVATKEFSREDVALSWSPPNASDAKGHIVLIGDSQARMSWGPAVGVVASRMGFKFTNLGQNSCPPTLEVVRLSESSQARPQCRDAMQSSLKTVLREKPSVVILVAADRYAAAASNSSNAAVAEGVVRVVKPIIAEGIPVLGIKATPHGPENVPACLMRAGKLAKRGPTNTMACSMVADAVLKVSCVEAAARMFPVLRLLSFDDYLCQGNVCPPVIGNVIVYRDQLHLTSAYSKTLANALQKEMLAAAPHLAGLVSEQSR